MDSITVKRPVQVWVRVSEKFKLTTAAHIQEQLQKLDFELEQLKVTSEQLLKQVGKDTQTGAALQRIEAEKNKRLEGRHALLAKLKEVGNWQIGQEIVQGQLESYHELRLGESWPAMFDVHVIIEDNIIVEIRQGIGDK